MVKDLIKSFSNFSWTLAVYGLRQGSSLLRGGQGQNSSPGTAASFNETAQVMQEQFGAVENAIFKPLKSVQDSVIDATFGAFGSRSLTGAEQAVESAIKRGVQAIEQGVQSVVPGSCQCDSSASSVQCADCNLPFAGRSGGVQSVVPGSCQCGSSASSVQCADSDLPFAVRSAGMEEVFIVYTAGRGKFSEIGPPYYVNLEVDLFDFNGCWIGYESGVNYSIASPQEGFATPDAPPLPISQPPVPATKVDGWTKALFTFNDGALIVEGPAQTHVVPITDGNALFMVTTSHAITGGTGAYEGARGTKQATGTGLIRPQDKFPSAGLTFTVTTVETFRFVRKQYLDSAASGKATRRSS